MPAGATVTPSLPATGASPLQANFTWATSPGDLGPHVLFFTATDSTLQQAQLSVTIQVVDEVLVSQSFDLCEGWNLVGMPFEPLVNDPAAVFGEGSLTVRLVRDTSHATDPRRPYKNVRYSYEDATQLKAYEAYFVYIPDSEGLSFTLNGRDPGDLTLALGAGWNLVGTPGLISMAAFRQTLSQVHTVTYWDCSEAKYVDLARRDNLQGGIGYFCYLVKAATLRFSIDRPSDARDNAEATVKIKKVRH